MRSAFIDSSSNSASLIVAHGPEFLFGDRYTDVMPLPKTVVVPPDWVRAQNPALWLTPGEMEIYTTWASEKRRSEWLAGRLAAKKLLQEELSLSPLGWQIGRDGVAPAIAGCNVPNLALSLSHSDGFGAATISDTRAEGSAGIDVQRVRPVHPGLCARVFTQGEQEQIAAQFGSENSADGMLLFWALKEAAIKARRKPWDRPLRCIAVYLEGAGSATVILETAQILTAHYTRLDEKQGSWWLARAVLRP